MKKTILKSEDFTQSSRKHSSNLMLFPVIPLTLFLTTLVLCFSACSQKIEGEDKLDAFKNTSAKTSGVQPLPGGKARFTVAVGNLDASGTTFVRIVNMTFTATSGTVAATVYEWINDQKKGKSVLNSHLCTIKSVSKTCNVYTPTGWISGGSSNPYKSWSGTYTYSGNTVTITWTSGKTGTETWTISNPTTALARASLASSSTAMGYTHGRGYGSNASWSTFKTITQMKPFPTYSETYSRRVGLAYDAVQGTLTLAPEVYSFNSWTKTNTDLALFTTPSSPTPANAAHRWDEEGYYSPGKCNENPYPGAIGVIYHIGSTNTSRAIAYTNNSACLSTASEFPCYPRNLHPSGLMQIIDDNSNMVALVGIEAQNPVPDDSGHPSYQFHLWDFNNIP